HTCPYLIIFHPCFLLSSYIFILSSFFFNDPSPTEIYTLSLHDALPILISGAWCSSPAMNPFAAFDSPCSSPGSWKAFVSPSNSRSEEHTSELQSPYDLVCRLLLEKKKKKYKN